MTKPLAGVRVIELGQLIAGPFAGRLLADFGAEVVKIEPPGTGDPLRQWRKLHRGTSLWWYVQNRNKKSVTANLRLPAGQEIVLPELVSDLLGQLEHHLPGLLAVHQILRAGDAVPDGLDGHIEILLHNPGHVVPRGVGPKAHADHAQQAL